jgi:hypothetical protein
VNSKKIVLCLSSLLLLPTFVFSGFGVKAGLNFNIMTHAGQDDLGLLTAWRLGGVYAWNLSKKLTLRPEIFLSQSGTRSKLDLFGESVAVSEKYLYVEVPLLAAYTLFSKNGLSLCVEAGGYGAYNLAARQTVSGPDGGHGDSIRNSISKFDLGLVLGLQLAKRIGKGNFTIDLRYQEGLVNVNKPTQYYPEMYNRMVELLLGYRFGR